MKRPSFQFYPADWLASEKVTSMTLEEQGAYLRLLAHCWLSEDCSIPNDDDALARLSGLGEKWVRGGYNVVKACFDQKARSPHRLTNLRLLEERKKQDEWREKSRRGGEKGAKKRWKPQEKQQNPELENGHGGGHPMVLTNGLPIDDTSSPSSSSEKKKEGKKENAAGPRSSPSRIQGDLSRNPNEWRVLPDHPTLHGYTPLPVKDVEEVSHARRLQALRELPEGQYAHRAMFSRTDDKGSVGLIVWPCEQWVDGIQERSELRRLLESEGITRVWAAICPAVTPDLNTRNIDFFRSNMELKMKEDFLESRPDPDLELTPWRLVYDDLRADVDEFLVMAAGCGVHFREIEKGVKRTANHWTVDQVEGLRIRLEATMAEKEAESAVVEVGDVGVGNAD